MTPGRLLYIMRRDWSRGWRAAYRDYVTAPKIESYRCPDFPPNAATVPIHILTGKDDWRLALWMLASFHYFTKRRWLVMVHDDGTLSAEAAAIFRASFPGLKLITRAEADAFMEPRLKSHPRCRAYRESHPLALKIFDVPEMSRGERILILDSDVLFFARPDDILDWVECRRDECRFIRDVAESSNVSAEEARERLEIALWPCVNSGVCLLPSAVVDLDFCERCFEQTGILGGHIWRVEQTLFALCASRYGRGGLLPNSYEVVLTPNGAVSATARHYVGAVRDRFYAEGLGRLERLLIT